MPRRLSDGISGKPRWRVRRRRSPSSPAFTAPHAPAPPRDGAPARAALLPPWVARAEISRPFASSTDRRKEPPKRTPRHSRNWQNAGCAVPRRGGTGNREPGNRGESNVKQSGCGMFAAIHRSFRGSGLGFSHAALNDHFCGMTSRARPRLRYTPRHILGPNRNPARPPDGRVFAVRLAANRRRPLILAQGLDCRIQSGNDIPVPTPAAPPSSS